MKTIVIEALSALQGGGQTYLLQLFQNIPASWSSKYRIVAILPGRFARMLPPDLPVEIITPGFPSRSLLNRVLWYRIRFPRLLKELRADVLFCPGGTLPTRKIRGARCVVTHQNMLPFDSKERKRYPFGYLRAKFWLLQFVQGKSFRDADLVIFISEYGKSSINNRIRQRRGGSTVIPHGVHERFSKRTELVPDELQGTEYVLYVSILDYYKAQIETVLAWSMVKAQRPTSEKLVLIGPENPAYGAKVRSLIRALRMEDDVLIRGNVPYDMLPAYYQNAKINLFSSSCENCPNILLEALAAGRPLLCSNYQPMPEFAGNAAGYYDPYDPKSLSELLMKYLDDEVLRKNMGKAAQTRALGYRWEVSAEKTWSALEELALRGAS